MWRERPARTGWAGLTLAGDGSENASIFENPRYRLAPERQGRAGGREPEGDDRLRPVAVAAVDDVAVDYVAVDDIAVDDVADDVVDDQHHHTLWAP